MLELFKEFTRALFVIGFIAMIVAGLNRCGRSNITPSNAEVDGLPSTWDGGSDYQAEGWRLELP